LLQKRQAWRKAGPRIGDRLSFLYKIWESQKKKPPDGLKILQKYYNKIKIKKQKYRFPFVFNVNSGLQGEQIYAKFVGKKGI